MSCTDEEHDQELFLEAYTSFKAKSGEFDSVNGLQQWFSGVERLPDSWPMARLAITLDGLALQLSKVVMTATMEIDASYWTPEDCLPSLTQLAKDVTTALALHLADLVANWLSGILDQHAVLLFNENTAAMLQASYIGFVRSMKSSCTPPRIRTKAPRWKRSAPAMVWSK